jgi:hypothetical protein
MWEKNININEILEIRSRTTCYLGVGAITNNNFNGSAEEYLPNNPNAKYLYVYKLARNCSEGNKYCYAVPYGMGAYGIDLDQSLFIGWRAYLENSKKLGQNTQRLYMIGR